MDKYVWRYCGSKMGLEQSRIKIQGVIFIYTTKIAKTICGLGVLGALGFVGAQINIPIPAYAETTQEDSIAKSFGKALADTIQETVESQYPYKAEGYENFADWVAALKAKIQELQVKISESRNLEYLYDEDVAALDNIEANISNAFSLVTLGEYENTINSMFDKSAARRAEAEAAEKKKALEQQQKQQSYSSSSGGLTKSGGVFNYNGRRETYYSSRVLYHYRTPEWWVDGEGFYRTSEGYYVVAASDMSQGTVFQGSKGMCQVLDSGCAAGTTDYYVSW